MQLQSAALARKLEGQGQVVQFPLDGEQAEDGGQRRVDVEGLVGDLLPLVARHAREGAQVVQPVRQLDDHHLELGRGAAEDLAVDQLLEGLAVAGVVGDLGASFDDGLDVRAEPLADHLAGDLLHVLHRIVEQGRGEDLRVTDVQFLGEDPGHRAGVHDVRIAGSAPLAAVGLEGEVQGVPEHPGLRTVADEAPHHLAVAVDIEFNVLHRPCGPRSFPAPALRALWRDGPLSRPARKHHSIADRCPRTRKNSR